MYADTFRLTHHDTACPPTNHCHRHMTAITYLFRNDENDNPITDQPIYEGYGMRVLHAFGAGEYPVSKEDLEETAQRLPAADDWNLPNASVLQAVIKAMSADEEVTVYASY